MRQVYMTADLRACLFFVGDDVVFSIFLRLRDREENENNLLEMNINRQSEFETLVEQHKATVYSVCYMFAESREDADDLFQEVLLKLWSGLAKFRGDASTKSWVYRVSMNTCISYKRKKKISTAPLDIAPEVIEGDSYSSRQTAMLRERIQRLQPFDRAIVLLWLENMSYDEIGAIVGLSPRNVGVRLTRIKDKLKTSND